MTTKLQALEAAYADLLYDEWSPESGVRYTLAHNFTNLAFAAMPDIIEAMKVLRRKMHPLTNDQETHDRALAVLEKLT